MHNSVLHEVLMDVVGRDAVHGRRAAQAVRAIGEAAGDAAFGAGDKAVLAVPGVDPATGVGQGVASDLNQIKITTYSPVNTLSLTKRDCGSFDNWKRLPTARLIAA